MKSYERIYTLLVNEGKISAGAGELVKATGRGIVKGTKGAGRFLKKTAGKKITGPESQSPIVKGVRLASAGLRKTGNVMKQRGIRGGKAVHAAGTLGPRLSKGAKEIRARIGKAASTPLSDQPTGEKKK